MTADATDDRDAPRESAAAAIGRIAIILVALAAAWVSLRHALHGLLEREFPALGIAISPASPVSESIVALNRVSRAGGTADARAQALLRDALRRAPMFADPLVVAGLDAGARDQNDRARRLFEEARARDPRSIITRYWLFDYYLRSGFYAEGIAEAQPLIRLQPAAEPAVVTVLTALLDVPAAREALIAGLRTAPGWRDDFFRQVSATPRLRERGLALLGTLSDATATGAPSASSVRDQEAMLRALVRQGAGERARQAWLATLPPAFRAKPFGIYDGSFAGWPGAPPFNWRLTGLDRGIVARQAAPELPGGTALAIRFDDDRARVLAEQMVPLPAGAWRLSFTVAPLDAASGSDTALDVRVRCATGRAQFARTAVPAPAAAAIETLAFTVPAACPVALVRFSAQPGIDPGPLDLLLSGVAISPR